jgi:hypothetical protein
MVDSQITRWPPIYDFEDLGRTISRLIENGEIFNIFYNCIRKENLPPFCQGDIVKVKLRFPFVNKEGEVIIFDEPFDYWIIIGNTCDLTNETIDSTFTHIAPVMQLNDINPLYLTNFKKYKAYKQFYLPSWEKTEDQDYYINFTQMVSVEKDFFQEYTDVVARLNFESWLLLHSCLVRYLARDDGRND